MTVGVERQKRKKKGRGRDGERKREKGRAHTQAVRVGVVVRDCVREEEMEGEEKWFYASKEQDESFGPVSVEALRQLYHRAHVRGGHGGSGDGG